MTTPTWSASRVGRSPRTSSWEIPATLALCQSAITTGRPASTGTVSGLMSVPAKLDGGFWLELAFLESFETQKYPTHCILNEHLTSRAAWAGAHFRISPACCNRGLLYYLYVAWILLHIRSEIVRHARTHIVVNSLTFCREGHLCDTCIPLPGCENGHCNSSFECNCLANDQGVTLWEGAFCDRRKSIA